MKADIAERLARLREDLEAELRACGREPGSVTIVGVTKKQPVEAMIEETLTMRPPLPAAINCRATCLVSTIGEVTLTRSKDSICAL